ncbi:MAG: ABC transporter substrate-binding protein [Microthrixaceae bacterium]
MPDEGQRPGSDALRRWRGHLLAAATLVLAASVAAVAGTTPAGPDLTSASRGSSRPDATSEPAAGEASGPAAAVDGAGPTAAGAGTGGTGGTGLPTLPGGTQKVYDQGVSDSEIKIGGSTFTSGPAAVYGEQIAVGFTAGVQYVNDHGGVNGRRISLKLYDDGADPAKQLANTKRLLEVDKVFALSMVYAASVGPYVAQSKVPVYHLGQFDDEFTNPYWFPVGGPQRLASYHLSNFGAKKLGVKSVAVFYLDAGSNNFSRAYAEDVATDWKAYGVDVPVLAPFAVDQTSCSDAIGKARDAGVDFIQFEIDAGKVINCGVEAQIQGYKPPKGWGGYLIGVPVIHEALGDFSEGMYAFDAFGALYDNPDYKAYVAKVSSKTESYSSVTMSYFVSALLMRDSLAQLGDNITRERLAQVLNGFTDWRPGLSDDPNQPIWTWSPSCHVALKGGYVIQIQKHDDKLKWTQITPQLQTTPVPPGQNPPARFSGCNIFER